MPAQVWPNIEFCQSSRESAVSYTFLILYKLWVSKWPNYMLLCCTELRNYLHHGNLQGCGFHLVSNNIDIQHGQILIGTETDSLHAKGFFWYFTWPLLVTLLKVDALLWMFAWLLTAHVTDWSKYVYRRVTGGPPPPHSTQYSVHVMHSQKNVFSWPQHPVAFHLMIQSTFHGAHR